MSAPTLVFARHGQIGSRQFLFGEECPPGMFTPETINQALDEGWLKEYDSSERPSLYRLFHRFSGSEQNQPTNGDSNVR
jgi:hypothetical protein